MEIHIEQASTEDASLVSGILMEAAQWLKAIGQPMWQTSELTIERILPDLTAGCFFIAKVGEEAAGVVKFTLSDPFFWPELLEGESAFIHRLAVRRAFAGAGIARALVLFARDRAIQMGRKHLRLDCASDRQHLRLFYEGLGFHHHSNVQAGPWHVSRYEMNTSLETN